MKRYLPSFALAVGVMAFSATANAQQFYFAPSPQPYPPPVFVGPMPGSTPMIVNRGAPVFSPGPVVQHYFNNYDPMNTVILNGARSALSAGAAMDGAMRASRFLAPNPWIAAGQILFVPNIVE